MKTNQSLRFLFLLTTLVLLLSSCERLFDKDADYRYRIENNTVSTVEVVVEIKQNPSVNIIGIGDPNRYYTIEPGGTAEVWATSGFTADEVHDEEKKNKEVYWISVSATNNGRPARSNLNSTGRWEYRKEGRYKATYTLTLVESDF